MRPTRVGLDRRRFLSSAAATLSAAPLLGAPSVASARTLEPIVADAADPFYRYGYLDEPVPLRRGVNPLVDWRFVDAGAVSYWVPGAVEAEPLLPTRHLEGVYGKQDHVPFGVHLIALPATRVGPVLRREMPWESFSIFPQSAINENGRLRLWYDSTAVESRTGLENPHSYRCYAESEDGYTWQRPRLGLVSFGGSTETNILRGTFGAVLVDPTAPSSERYRTLVSGLVTDEQIERFRQHSPDGVSPLTLEKHEALYAATSSNGLEWTTSAEPVCMYWPDTQAIPTYDAILRRYVGFFRTRFHRRRMVGRAETTDFFRWPVPRTVFVPGPSSAPYEDIYQTGYSLYPGSQDAHVMVTTIYRRDVDSTYFRLASSPEGTEWSFLTEARVLESGPEGTWDGGCIFGMGSLVALPDGAVALPYAGYERPHKFPRYEPRGMIGLAVWPGGRIAAIEATDRGEFSTLRLRPEGTRLLLDVATEPGGEVVVDIVDREGVALPSDPISGDHHRVEVTWGGSPRLRMEPRNPDEIRFRFRLRQARLFALVVT